MSGRPPAKQVGEAFWKIADEAIRAAGQVDCTLEQVEGGLLDIRDAIQDRLDEVRDELRQKAGGGV